MSSEDTLDVVDFDSPPVDDGAQNDKKQPGWWWFIIQNLLLAGAAVGCFFAAHINVWLGILSAGAYLLGTSIFGMVACVRSDGYLRTPALLFFFLVLAYIPLLALYLITYDGQMGLQVMPEGDWTRLFATHTLMCILMAAHFFCSEIPKTAETDKVFRFLSYSAVLTAFFAVATIGLSYLENPLASEILRVPSYGIYVTTFVLVFAIDLIPVALCMALVVAAFNGSLEHYKWAIAVGGLVIVWAFLLPLGYIVNLIPSRKQIEDARRRQERGDA